MNNSNKNPLVSVIIPAYNAEKYVRRALDSVRDQTYPDLEICLTNDGSTDRTEAMVKEFIRTHPRLPFTYIVQENRGLSAARNAAVARSRGEYLVFLDSDDRLLPECVETLVAYTRRYPDVGIISGGSECRKFDGSGNLLSRGVFQIDESIYLTPREVFKGLFYYNYLGIISVLIRRELFQRAGGFNECFRACEDLAFWLQAARSNSFLLIPELLGVLYKYPSGLSQNPATIFHYMGKAYFDNKAYLFQEYPREGKKVFRKAIALTHLIALSLYRFNRPRAIFPMFYHLFGMLIRSPKLVFSRKARHKLYIERSFFIPLET